MYTFVNIKRGCEYVIFVGVWPLNKVHGTNILHTARI